jgi:hypothetical protein
MKDSERRKKCEAIVRRIAEICNDDGSIMFEDDMGGNSLTIVIPKRGHTHVGYTDAPFDLLVDNLFNSLHGGPGLSWVKATTETSPDAKSE